MVVEEVKGDALISNAEIAALFRELDEAEATVRRVRDDLRVANLKFMAREGYRGLSLHALRREVTR